MRLKSKISLAQVLSFLILLLSLGILLFQLVPMQVIQYADEYLPMEKKQYSAGEVLEYRAEFCKSIDAVGTITYQLINGRSLLLGSVQSNVPKGCYDFTGSTVVLPTTTHKGTYRLLITTQYNVFGVRTITRSIYTEPFEVQ